MISDNSFDGTKPPEDIVVNARFTESSNLMLANLYKKNRMEFGSEPYVGQRVSLIQKIKVN